MPEGARTGEQQQQQTKKIVYVGTMEGVEIAEAGIYAAHGEPVDVPNRSSVKRHLLDEHGNRYQDVRYPGLAEQLLQRPDFIEAGDKKAIKQAAESVREIELAPNHAVRRVFELGLGHGEHVDEVVMGEPGYQVVPHGTPLPGPGGDVAPVEPVVVPEGAQSDVQPHPPVNLQPAAPGDQTGTAPDADVKEGDAETDKQRQPGRARTRSSSRSATRRG